MEFQEQSNKVYEVGVTPQYFYGFPSLYMWGGVGKGIYTAISVIEGQSSVILQFCLQLAMLQVCQFAGDGTMWLIDKNGSLLNFNLQLLN